MLIKSKIDNLYGICCFYEGCVNLAGLATRIASIWCNKVYAIDGRFAKYKGRTINSQDGTASKISEWADFVIYALEPWETEVDKRTYSINLVPKGSYGFVFDVDELFFGDWRNLWIACSRETFEVGWVLEYHLNRVTQWRPRIFKCDGKMEYKYNHYTLYKDDKKLYEPIFEDNGEGHVKLPINFLHLRSFAADYYRKKQLEYMKNNKEPWAGRSGCDYN